MIICLQNVTNNRIIEMRMERLCTAKTDFAVSGKPKQHYLI